MTTASRYRGGSPRSRAMRGWKPIICSMRLRASFRRWIGSAVMAWPAPIVVFFYVLVVKGCLFDGWPGWFYTLQRVLAECMIALELIDRRISRTPSR